MVKINTFLEKEMTRRQFLLTLGTGMMSLVGLTALMGMLTPEEKTDNSGLPGYGVQNYGP